MSLPALSCEEFLADFHGTAARWLVFLTAHPDALAVPCDIAGSHTVGEVVWHIYSVSVRHSQRLLGEEVNLFPGGADGSLATIRALMGEAHDNLRRFLAASTPASIDEQFDYVMRTGGQLRCSRRKLFIHVMQHAVRHWAQISTLLRQNGMKADWQQDFLVSNAIV